MFPFIDIKDLKFLKNSLLFQKYNIKGIVAKVYSPVLNNIKYNNEKRLISYHYTSNTCGNLINKNTIYFFGKSVLELMTKIENFKNIKY